MPLQRMVEVLGPTFRTHVLDITDGIDHLGAIKPDLAWPLFLSWLVVYFCLVRGVQTTGKMVYVTATVPFVILLAMLIRGLAMSGSSLGIRRFFIPNYSKLFTIGVWKDATEQLFFSLCCSWGGLIMFGSYNKFDYKVYWDTMIVTIIDLLTSIVSGVIIFMAVGHMSHVLDVPFDQAANQGTGLAFVAYPETLSHLVGPKIWSAVFFFLLFILGIDTEYVFVEIALTTLSDHYPRLRSYKVYTSACACIICLLAGLCLVTQGGQYVLTLLDSYAGGFSIIFIALCEFTFIMWGYGISRVCDDFEFMLGWRPGAYLQLCWSVVTPLTLIILFTFSLMDKRRTRYPPNYIFPNWAEEIGWSLNICTLMQIPIWALIAVFENRKNLWNVFKPTEAWGPKDPKARRKLRELAEGRKKQLIVQIL